MDMRQLLSKSLLKRLKNIRIRYPEYGTGIKGLTCGLAAKALYCSLPTIYSNNVLRSMHHPKLGVAYLELTNSCNLKCKMCTFQQVQKNIGYMSKTNFKSYIDQLSDMGVNTLFLQLGGESLLHPEFKDFLRYAIKKRNEEKRIGMILWTDNGMLFDESISDLVVDLKVDTIYFSLDGVGQVNDDIRLGSKYSTIEKNVKYLLKRRGTSLMPAVELYVVDYGKTEEQKIEIYREWINVVDQIVLIAFIQPDNSIGNKDSFSTCVKTPPAVPFCKYPFQQMTISWDGKVSACPMDYAFKMDLGDATKEPLSVIWRGSNFQALRRSTVTHTFPADHSCYACENWKISFKNQEESILDGTAKIVYGNRYTKIQKANK